ncbi:amidohydrolase family protein [Tuwongella immobilis]|uniref:Amidohydrolase-related domain-containing protein n=1 Tax=Tuwongella immobilis TaxID=692036 RepID=A0A6C2YLA7_9BACT|nr:amidohydrolase family protein [Tuwongella immobilis]VIP02358.1 amidohydrolase : Amidohydrolase 2 OS=Planctomyces brasiliensis (strain ATCC 49424 / DSM 5305 / JCM 21570 / NBRC 103401 / IFAM 1448) GN=Plabr_3926 PE=4 SV=1: Amidohydro_2 [Tuwongella immobilis]VTS01160.1 amidohydrolase : Amidohydrolase 2 OS=Planctomyces brasiliensis (strain ATCC 49424 / DSM 5305 / JCM 21570 / NBRC 103401 / IFAM 1448) GN=Plabr_3926 PE=4 SV=1: Amidohydro_2 [Tuwongella immobilis]
MPSRIDSHQHFWDLETFSYPWLHAPALQPICRSFLPADLAPMLQQSGIEQSIFVQVQHTLDENRWVLKLVEANPFIAGVVGWVDLASPAVEEQLAEFTPHPKFVGIRHITQDEPDDDFIIRPDIRRGLAALEKHSVPFDLLFYVKHLKHTVALATEFPNLPMVIDHLSKPVIKAQSLADWEANFRAAAQFPNVYCKLSGMITEADWASWKPADLKPYIDIALEAFTPKRLMFGSDWPVCLLAGRYAQVVDALEANLAGLSADEREQIFCRTAREFYRLPE